jgi:hypothetical protein
MPGEPPAPAVTIEQRRVHQASLIRAFVVCAIWLATWPLRPSGAEVRLGLNLMLALGGWWAMLPGRRAGGKIFGEHGHWSTLIVGLPIGFGIAAAAELWHMLRGTG